MNQPMITVLMPVYNAEQFLAEAIESILAQTFGDFEFLIINDGSTDSSLDIINKFAQKDERIKVISRSNSGLVTALNVGLSKANGNFIARQDADDISPKNRLQVQVKYLENNPSIGLVGSNYHVIDENGRIITTSDIFTEPSDIQLAEVFVNQMGHGSVLIRKSLLGGLKFDKKYTHAEDYDLWTRLLHRSGIGNISEPLYKWRLHSKGVTTKQAEAMEYQTKRIRLREFQHFRKNKKRYRLFSLHPFSTHGGTRFYLEKKSSLFRDIALMYCYIDLRRWAAMCLLVAIVWAPWKTRSYRQLFMTLFNKKSVMKIGYEYHVEAKKY